MRKLDMLILALLPVIQAGAQKQDKITLTGMYIQWGYNAEAYTRSNIHFNMANGDAFTLKHAKAHDRGDYKSILKEPGQVSIPQYSYRIGFYLNQKQSRAIELNFDHAKYIVTDGQTVRVKGNINGQPVDTDSTLNPDTFLHFEHTDGANWLHINYVWHETIFTNASHSRPLLAGIYKAGAGINIPRTDFTWRGDRYNNQFHIAGYNISAEAGVRFYPFRNFFLETTGKTGYVRYVNALANTATNKGNKASHGFGYVEGIFTLGYSFKF